MRSLFMALALSSVIMPATADEPPIDAADIESLEACVLESAVLGHELDCIGLVSEGCLGTQDTDVCAYREGKLWLAVLRDHQYPLPLPDMLREVADCLEAGRPRGACERDTIAARAIPALMSAEAQ